MSYENRNILSSSNEDDFFWHPTVGDANQSAGVKLIRMIESKYGPLPPSAKGEVSDKIDKVRFEQLHKWSVDYPGEFWSEIWDFSHTIGYKNPNDPLVIYGNHPVDTLFLPNAKFNLAENALANKNPDDVAFISWGENIYREYVTHQQLYERISVVVQALQAMGFKAGDRAVGICPLTVNPIVVKLAVYALGGIYSSCSPDFGVSGIVDRFNQMDPKVLFSTDFYLFKNVVYEVIPKAKEVFKQVKSLEKLVIFPYCNSPPLPVTKPAISLAKFVSNFLPKNIPFVRLGFNEPVQVVFSSGTTGRPKGFVHRNGTLLKTKTEYLLHADMKPGERVYHVSTTSWIMYDFYTCGLTVDLKMAMYDGNVIYPTPDILFKFAQDTKLNYLGISSKFMKNVKLLGVRNLSQRFDLSNLRILATTGSPVPPVIYNYIYSDIKSGVYVLNMYGGSDIAANFCDSNPWGPIFPGEIQTASLGMDIRIVDDDGKEAQKGELVVASPFMTQPIMFLGDPDKEQFKSTYYTKFPNYWTQGDIVERTPNNGYIVHGRSDNVLKPGGVRIGTTEIYKVLESVPEISECAAVGVDYDDDVLVYLFVTLSSKGKLEKELKDKIKHHIRTNLTPRHVPYTIISVSEIPITKTAKISELAIKDILHHRKVSNLIALENPHCLEEYKQYAIPLKNTIRPKL